MKMPDSPDVAVVEKVVGARLEGVDVEQPAVKGNLHAELVLLIALAAQGNEAGIGAVGKGQRGAGEAGERRRLIEVTVKGAEHPIEFWNLHGSSHAGIDGVFADSCLEVCLPLAAHQSKPRRGLVLVFEESFLHASHGILALGEVGKAAIVEDYAEQVSLSFWPYP